MTPQTNLRQWRLGTNLLCREDGCSGGVLGITNEDQILATTEARRFPSG